MSAPVSPRALVCLATYNERGNLAKLVEAIHRHAPLADVVVIDDNSPDGTGRFAEKIAAGDPQLSVLHRPEKLGLGTAILAGMHLAIKRRYDLFVSMDADGSHAPHHLPALLAGMDRHDVMIGSRYTEGGGTRNWPRSRLWMSRGVNLLSRVLLRLAAHDCSSGYRCYRVAKLKEARLDRMMSYGYSFEEEVLYRCGRVGCRLGETPIVFENRRVGTSKLNVREAARSVGVLLYLGVRVNVGVE